MGFPASKFSVLVACHLPTKAMSYVVGFYNSSIPLLVPNYVSVKVMLVLEKIPASPPELNGLIEQKVFCFLFSLKIQKGVLDLISGLLSSTTDSHYLGDFSLVTLPCSTLAFEVPMLMGIQMEKHEESNVGILCGQVWSDSHQFH